MNIEFINTAKSTRSGFYHKTELYIDSEFILECKCNYINRTWESYPYQSVMKDALYKAIESEILREKNLKGIKRLTKQLRETIVKESTLIQALTNKRNSL